MSNDLPGAPVREGQVVYGWRREREEVSEEPVPAAAPHPEPDPED